MYDSHLVLMWEFRYFQSHFQWGVASNNCIWYFT